MDSIKLKSDGWQKLGVLIQVFFGAVAVIALFTGLHIVQEFKQIGEIEIFIENDCKVNDFSVTEGVNFIIVGKDLTTFATMRVTNSEGIEVVSSATLTNKDRVTYNFTKSSGEYFLHCNENKTKIIVTPPKYKSDYRLIEEE